MTAVPTFQTRRCSGVNRRAHEKNLLMALLFPFETRPMVTILLLKIMYTIRQYQLNSRELSPPIRRHGESVKQGSARVCDDESPFFLT